MHPVTDLIWLNIVAAGAEFTGTFMATVIGVGGAVITAEPLGTGFAFGFGTLVATAYMWMRSGAHLNPAITGAKLGAWLLGLQARDYYGFQSIISDFIAAIVYWAMQFAAIFAAIALLAWFDQSALDAFATTVPNGPLHHEDFKAFLALTLFNMFVILGALKCSHSYTKEKPKYIMAPIVMGSVVGASVLFSVHIGTGSVLNFATDAALTVFTNGTNNDKLWISLLGQSAGAILALGAYWVVVSADMTVNHIREKHSDVVLHTRHGLMHHASVLTKNGLYDNAHQLVDNGIDTLSGVTNHVRGHVHSAVNQVGDGITY